MLQNNGAYGPADMPLNMGAPRNVPQLNPINMSNLNNLGVIPQQQSQMLSGHFNPHNNNNFHQQHYDTNADMTNLPNYHFQRYPENYLHRNVQENVANGMLPMNLNVQGNNNLPNYHNYDCRVAPNNQINSNYKNLEEHPKMPINAPLIHTKTFHKNISDYNHEISQKNDETSIFHSPVSMSDVDNSRRKSLENTVRLIENTHSMNTEPVLMSNMDNSRRKSLENTVRLIENIIMNSTSKNSKYEMGNDKQISKIDRDPTAQISKEKILKASNQFDDSSSECLKNVNIEQQNTIDISILEKKVDYESTKSPENSQNTSENKINIEDLEFHKTHITSQDIDEMSDSEPESLKSEVKVEVLIKSEPTDSVTVKVEPSSWIETDYYNPFPKDANGISKDNLDCNVIAAENSINEAMDAVNNEIKNEARFECPYCNILFAHPKRFLIHVKWHSFGSIMERQIVLAKEKEIRRSLQREEKIMEVLSTKEVKDLTIDGAKFPCKDCDKVFVGKSSLRNHRTRYHGANFRACRICHKTVAGQAAMRAHMTTHQSDTYYQCTECPKRFKHVHSLTKHRDTHLEKIYQCPKCPKLFGSEKQLKIHDKCHERSSKEATLSCSYCGKGFHESYNLQVHERTHRNEKPFVCTICNASYGTNSSLQRHIKVSHSKSKPFECSTCHRCFATEAIRNGHELRLHSDPDDLKFPCKQCKNRYTTLKDLKKHIYKAHPKGRKRKKDSDSE